MSWYGDPDDLDRLGRQLSAAAVRIRDLAGEVRSSPATARWRGPAADAFQSSVLRESTVLDGAAGELDDAAAALHRHADTVRARIADLLAIERAAERWLSAGWSTLAELLP